MSALDEEDYGDIADEDFIEAFSQTSQDLPPHSRSTKRRRIREVSSDGSIDTQQDLIESGVSGDEDEENGISRKKKYKIHTGVADVLPGQILGATQADGLPDSSPYRIRGPIYRIPRPEPPKPPIFSATTSRAAPLPKATVYTSPKQLKGHLQDKMAQELENLPSDFVSTPSPRPKSLQSSLPSQRVVASQAGLRQTTLFGHSTPEEVSVSQVHKKHNFIVDMPPELPTHHRLDHEALKTWIYPTNLGKIRDYQFSIVRNGLFNNLLVALPTGLGKTFIAATIMLNYFRWTKDAQIVFVAPTKPLVAQQVDACFKIVGIPRSATTMLTGAQPPALRAEEWLEKRVFFMTPQTLMHDLSNGIADPKKIVLLVVDEAHRATGNYAYVKVVQFLRRFNTSFRIHALTATPGASVEAVQEVIDGLGISKVEIRTEESIDIQQFVHRRDIDQILLDPSYEITLVKELYSKALQPLVNQLCGQNAYWNRDPMSLTSFGLIQARKKWFMSDVGRTASFGLKGMMNGLFAILASVAHGIKLLNYHGIGPFFAAIKEFRQPIEDGNKGGNYRRQIVESPDFKKMMDKIQLWVNRDDFVGHPKLTHLCNTILNHFLDAGENRLQDGVPPSNTRVIVFSEYRDSAEDIARTLNKHGPMIRASVFVGQADSKRSEGMNQAKQLETIRKFQAGLFNVIVATSIGEEGLDIGQVDLIVCYDASGSPIRMLQRMGRTGRKRVGNIVLLLMRGKEEEAFTKAKDNYEQMQKMISSGDRFNFRHDLSSRIIPREVKPVVDKKLIDIPTENAQDGSLPEPRRRSTATKMATKKFHMPDGVETGFQKASRFSQGAALTDFGITTKAKQEPKSQLAPIPSVDSVLLSPEDTKELEQRYQHVPGSDFQEVGMPDMTAQTAAQRSLLPIANIPHGQYTKKCVILFKTLAGSQRPEDRYVKPYGDEELGEIYWTAPPLLENERHAFMDSARMKKAGPGKRNQPDCHILTVSDDESDDEQDAPMPTRPQNARQRALSISEDENSSQPIAPTKRQQTRKRTIFRSSEAEGVDLANSETPSEDSDDSASLKYFVAEDEEEPAIATLPSTRSSTPSAVSPIPKLFYEPTQFPATQDTNDDDMPDIGEIVGRTKPKLLTPLEDRDIDDEDPAGPHRRKRKRLVEDDSDE